MKMMTVIFALIGAVVLILLMPMFITSLHDMQVDDQTDVFAAVATGAGVTNTTQTLTQALWQEDTQYVSSITSDLGTDNPSATSYTTASKGLLISGLTANTSRNLTVVYDTTAMKNYEGMTAMAGITPLMVFLGIILIPIVALWFVFKR